MKNRLILDACTFINLFQIDENDFLLDLVKKLEFNISEEVLKEISNKIEAKFSYCKKIKIPFNREKESQIPIHLAYLRRVCKSNQEIKKDLGKCFEDIKSYCCLTKKENGELYSCALSLIKSRVEEKQMVFVTDDLPAKQALNDFFCFQQIGNILDTADLLIYMYWYNSKFTLRSLKNYLSSLAAEYNSDLVMLKRKLTSFREQQLNRSIKDRNKKILGKLEIIIEKLEKLDFSQLKVDYEYFKGNRDKTSKDILTILKTHSKIFELEFECNGNNIINKVKNLRQNIDKYELYKIA